MHVLLGGAATTELYTLSLHDALPIFRRLVQSAGGRHPAAQRERQREGDVRQGLPRAEHLRALLLPAERRSEERRVGKEGRSRWRPQRYIKKEDASEQTRSGGRNVRLP